jgi:hypothetical protein
VAFSNEVSFAMRLLDSIAHSHAPLPPKAELKPFAQRMAECPLRFVLGDDLTRASAELAFADGARLAGCLDLLRMPAPQMWVEWNDEVHKRVIYETQSAAEFDRDAVGRRVGVLLRASADGFQAIARTFWTDASVDETAEVTLSPLETHIDLRGEFAHAPVADDALSGGFIDVTDGEDPGLASLLDHVRFRFEDSWAAYYRAAAADASFRRRLIHCSVAAVVRDAPFLLAFMLLLSAKDATRRVAVSRAAINHKRAAHGRAPLLDHIEVNASLDAVSVSEPKDDSSGRLAPRLHHVRGHLVRRDHHVFWRVPHLRGSASRGIVHSRTVCLSLTGRGGEARA